jgi:hypothetical protein
MYSVVHVLETQYPTSQINLYISIIGHYNKVLTMYTPRHDTENTIHVRLQYFVCSIYECQWHIIIPENFYVYYDL